MRTIDFNRQRRAMGSEIVDGRVTPPRRCRVRLPRLDFEIQLTAFASQITFFVPLFFVHLSRAMRPLDPMGRSLGVSARIILLLNQKQSGSHLLECRNC